MSARASSSLHLGHPEEGAVGDDGDGERREAFDLVDELAHREVERRLSRAGQRDDVGLLLHAREMRLELVEHLAHGAELPPLARLVGRRSAFAVDAVEGARLVRDDVDPERNPEPSRGDGAEDSPRSRHSHEPPPRFRRPAPAQERDAEDRPRDEREERSRDEGGRGRKAIPEPSADRARGEEREPDHRVIDREAGRPPRAREQRRQVRGADAVGEGEVDPLEREEDPEGVHASSRREQGVERRVEQVAEKRDSPLAESVGEPSGGVGEEGVGDVHRHVEDRHEVVAEAEVLRPEDEEEVRGVAEREDRGDDEEYLRAPA